MCKLAPGPRIWSWSASGGAVDGSVHSYHTDHYSRQADAPQPADLQPDCRSGTYAPGTAALPHTFVMKL